MTASESSETFSNQHIKLTVEQTDGAWCTINMVAKVPLAPPLLFDMLTHHENYRFFRSIKEIRSRRVLCDDGQGRQEVEVEQVGRWRFGPFQGSFPVLLRVVQDKRRGTMTFRLSPAASKKSFMRDFTGEWTLQPFDHDALEEMAHPGRHWGPLRDAAKALHRFEHRLAGRPQASLVQLRQSVQPAITPPAMLSGILKKIAAAQVRTVMEDLLAEVEKRNDAERRAAQQRGGLVSRKDSLERYTHPLALPPSGQQLL